MNGDDLHVLQQLLENKTAEAESKRRHLAAELETARRSEKVWKRLLKAHKHGHSAEVVYVFRRDSDVFAQQRDRNEEAIPLFELLYRSSEKQATETIRRFATLFPRACDSAGIEIDSSSRHPKYSIREFIQTIVNERKLEAQVTPRDAHSVIIPLDIDPLVSYLQSEVRRLFETKRDPKRLLIGLRTAYKAVLRQEKKSYGDELPLRRVANRLSKNWKHFRYDEFNVDLGNLVRSGETFMENVRLHLNHTRDTRQGMLLYGLERSGYLGFISFKREEL